MHPELQHINYNTSKPHSRAVYEVSGLVGKHRAGVGRIMKSTGSALRAEFLAAKIY